MSVRYLRDSLAILAASVAMISRPAAADFVVRSWDFGCGVAPPGSGGQGVVFNVVVNPFSDSHSVALQGGLASAAYQVGFSPQVLDFRVDASLAAPGSPPTFDSACDGGIVIANGALPLLVTVDSNYAWHLLGGPRESYLNITVLRQGGGDLFNRRAGAATDFGDPPVGNATLSGSVILPPNGTYILEYDMYVTSYGGSPSVLAYADGFVHYHASVVPEIGTLALTSVGALAVRRRLGWRPALSTA